MTGNRLSTDRVDGTIIARCPNKEHPDDDHLRAEEDYEEAYMHPDCRTEYIREKYNQQEGESP